MKALTPEQTRVYRVLQAGGEIHFDPDGSPTTHLVHGDGQREAIRYDTLRQLKVRLKMNDASEREQVWKAVQAERVEG